MAHIRFSLFRFRSPLLTESRLFSLPVGTEMFHFPTFPLSALYIQAEIMGHDSHWVPPFGNPRIKALLAAPRGFSQPHTTFFGFWSLGIRHLHLIIFLHIFYIVSTSKLIPEGKTFNIKDARVHCVVLKIRASLGADNRLSDTSFERPTVRLLTKSRGFVPSGPNNVHEALSKKGTFHSSPCGSAVLVIS